MCAPLSGAEHEDAETGKAVSSKPQCCCCEGSRKADTANARGVQPGFRSPLRHYRVDALADFTRASEVLTIRSVKALLDLIRQATDNSGKADEAVSTTVPE